MTKIKLALHYPQQIAKKNTSTIVMLNAILAKFLSLFQSLMTTGADELSIVDMRELFVPTVTSSALEVYFEYVASSIFIHLLKSIPDLLKHSKHSLCTI